MKLICLHGFLGTDKDFDFLKPHFDFIAPHLDDFVDNSLPEIHENILRRHGEHGNMALVGYSFGARLALRLISTYPDIYSKAILFAGHAGLSPEVNREERSEFENQMVKNLQNLERKNFFDLWNSYGIFSADSDILDHGQNFDKAQKYFLNWGLSKQEYLKELLYQSRDKIFWNYGFEDSKYADYARTELSEFQVSIHEGIGHRFLQHPELVQSILRNIIGDIK